MNTLTMAPCGLQKILIVDDDVRSTNLLKMLLERTGRYAVSVENESENAIEASVRLHPDLILLDIVMPHLDGTTLAYRIRSHAGLEDIPIIFVTGVVPRETSSPHSKLGDFPFIPKPVDMQEALDTIGKVLPPRA